MRNFSGLLFIVSFALHGCANNVPVSNDEPWLTATPEEQGFDSEVLLGLLQRIDTENLDVHAMVLMRDGKIFFEFYNYPYGPNTLHHTKSVGKSVLSALTGIALEQGHLTALNVPILNSFPEYKAAIDDPRKADITLFDALTMTAGLDIGDDNPNSLSSILLSDNWVEATWDEPMINNPGDAYNYSSFVSHLIAVVTERAVEADLIAYAQSELFEPLGMGELQFDRDPQGNWFGAGPLWMTPRDMLRFGQLYLDEGSWLGEQIVPRSWVRESTRNQIGELSSRDLEFLNARYGYQWWIFDGAYAAIGVGGQLIFVIPDLDFVAVITSAAPEIDLVDEYILTALKSAWFPAKANPGAQAAVAKLVDKLATPRTTKTAEWPPLASELSGRRFEVLSTDIVDSPSLIRAFTLQFDDASGVASILFETTDNTQLVTLGDKAAPALSAANVDVMRPDGENDIAAAGWWLSEKEFSIDVHEVGFPIKERWHIRFEKNSAAVSVKSRGAATHEITFSAQANSGS